MAKIPFTGGSYQTKVTDNLAAQSINWFPVLVNPTQSDPAKHDFIMMPTPGLKSPLVTLTAGSVVRGMIEHKGTLYAVAANKFYSVNTSGTETERGTLSTSSGRVRFAAIDDEILMLDGTKGYTYIPSTTTFAEITDADFNDTATSCTAQDSYFIVAKPSTDQFYISNSADGQTWDTLDFATAEGEFDDLEAVISDHRNLYLIGTQTTEVWFNSGDTFPFARNSSVFMDYGCRNSDTVAKVGESLMWLGRRRDGDDVIVLVSGFQAQIVSNRGITYQISKMTTTSDAYAYSYQQEGHIFYVLTFPTDEKTFVYDLTMGMWHERASLESASQNRHRSNAYAFFNGKHYVGDYNSGKICELDTETYDEDGSAITRTRIDTVKWDGARNARVTVDKLQIDFETAVGTDIDVSLSISTNGGNTFGTAKTRTISSSSTDYDRRVIWDRLGSHRNITLKLTTSENARIVVLGAEADFSLND